MGKAKWFLSEKGQSVVSYMLGLIMVATVVGAIVADLSGLLATFHEVSMNYIRDLQASGL